MIFSFLGAASIRERDLTGMALSSRRRACAFPRTSDEDVQIRLFIERQRAVVQIAEPTDAQKCPEEILTVKAARLIFIEARPL